MNFWRNLPVAQKLYWLIGTMIFLLAAELIIMIFAIQILSAVRAFVGGESLWSKGQKNAAFRLQRFEETRDEQDILAFLHYLKVPEGDHEALVEIKKDVPDTNKIREGFLKGGIAEADIVPMTQLFHRFKWESHIARAIDVWSEADELLIEFKDLGLEYYKILKTRQNDKMALASISKKILALNDQLTLLEEEFSRVLGEGSRWIEGLIVSLLTLIILSVAATGMGLTVFTTQYITQGLLNISATASKIGLGDFSSRVEIRSKDEIGKLSQSINKMGELLEISYKVLEHRVRERTAALSAMAKENADLYRQSSEAVKMRDEFMSIASHELKTPLTSLHLQLQILTRLVDNLPPESKANTLKENTDRALRQTKRLSRLAEELLDLTRLKLNKLELKLEKTDLTSILFEVVSQNSFDAAQAGSVVTVDAPSPIIGDFDPVRIAQVFTNLVSNAIKYGEGKPIAAKIYRKQNLAVAEFHDHGMGVPLDQQERAFERFQRVSNDEHIVGLGLGLYITRQIVMAHGGTVSLKSQPGEGSVFRVELPLSTQLLQSAS